MSPVSPAAIKKRKQRLWITNEKKKVDREKDKLAREGPRQTMSPEKKEVQRKERKRKCQAESAKEAAKQKKKTETQKGGNV